MGRGVGSFDPLALRNARLARNLTRAGLAEHVGCGTRQIAAYEQGQVPEPQRLKALAVALKVLPAELMGGGAQSLADLRRAAGLTAEQAAKGLDMSRNTYRKLERDGIYDRRNGYALINACGQLYRVDPRVVLESLPVKPAAIRRRLARIHLDELAEAAASPTGDITIRRGDPRLTAIARGLGYPIDTVRPALENELKEIREAAEVEVMASAVTKWYERNPDDDPVLRHARGELEKRKSLLGDRLLQTFSGLMPQAEWAVLADIYRFAPDDSPVTDYAPSALATLIRKGLIEAAPPPSGTNDLGRPAPEPRYVITPSGSIFYRRNFPRHRQVYRNIRATPPPRMRFTAMPSDVDI